MGKIDAYKLIKINNEFMIEGLLLVSGKLGGGIDKNYIGIDERRNHSSEPPVGFLQAQYGYVGNRSVKDISDSNMVRYIRRAINALMPQIVEKAIEFAKKDIESARLAAVDEANEVLKAAGPEMQDIPNRTGGTS